MTIRQCLHNNSQIACAEENAGVSSFSELCDLRRIFNEARLSAVGLKAEKASLSEFQNDIAGENIVIGGIDGAPIGFASVWLPGKFIHHLYVAPEYQSRGFGKTLLDECKNQFGLPLSLQCVVSNRRACAFYERNGWVAGGFTMGIDGHYIDFWRREL